MIRKLFIGMVGVIATAAAVTATVSSVNSAPKMSDLMSQNLEALTQNPEGDTYHKGTTGTNWKTYSVPCTTKGTQTTTTTTTSSGYNVDVNVPVPNTPFTAGGGAHNNQTTTNTTTTGTEPTTYYKDVCGSGAGGCFASAPSGDPCA